MDSKGIRDIPRTDEEKGALTNHSPNEQLDYRGIHQEEWVIDSFQQADCIIFLDTPYKIRIFRIIKDL